MKIMKEFDEIVSQIITSENDVGDILRQISSLDIKYWKEVIYEFRHNIKRPSCKYSFNLTYIILYFILPILVKLQSTLNYQNVKDMKIARGSSSYITPKPMLLDKKKSYFIQNKDLRDIKENTGTPRRTLFNRDNTNTVKSSFKKSGPGNNEKGEKGMVKIKI